MIWTVNFVNDIYIKEGLLCLKYENFVVKVNVIRKQMYVFVMSFPLLTPMNFFKSKNEN